MEKKTRLSIPKQAKVRAELQKEIGSICPFCTSEDVGHFEIHHMDEDPSNNLTSNLLLLCPTCHSKITKGDIGTAVVLRRKIELLTQPPKQKLASEKTLNFNSKVVNSVVGDNNTISIQQAKKTVKQKYPEGCIGFDTVKANYVGHLIKRYNEYKEKELGKGNVNWGQFGNLLKRQYKIPPTRTIYNLPIKRFEDLVDYIQSRIDGTTFARKMGRGHKNYSSFEEYSSSQDI